MIGTLIEPIFLNMFHVVLRNDDGYLPKFTEEILSFRTEGKKLILNVNVHVDVIDSLIESGKSVTNAIIDIFDKSGTVLIKLSAKMERNKCSIGMRGSYKSTEISSIEFNYELSTLILTTNQGDVSLI